MSKSNSSSTTIKVVDDKSDAISLIKVGARKLSMLKEIAKVEQLSLTKIIKLALDNFLLTYYMNGKNVDLHSKYKLVKKDEES